MCHRPLYQLYADLFKPACDQIFAADNDSKIYFIITALDILYNKNCPWSSLNVLFSLRHYFTITVPRSLITDKQFSPFPIVPSLHPSVSVVKSAYFPDTFLQNYPLTESVSILPAMFQEHERRQNKRHQFRCRSCQPDTVYSKYQRQRQHGNQHKYEGS